MYSPFDGPRRTVFFILLMSLACIAALLLLTSESFGLKSLRLFPANSLRSHHQHHHSSSAHPAWPDQDQIVRERADTGVKKLFAGDHKKKVATCEYIEVVVPGDASSLAGTVAVVNSVLRHTNQSVRFHLVVPHQTVTILRQWLGGIPDNRLQYQIIAFPERLLKLANNDVASAEVFLAGILPTNITGRVIFINNDAIVQGDIAELQQVPIAVHSFGAFLLDSQSETHADLADKPLYSQQVNMMNRFVHKRHIKGTRVTFSGGVFVANMKYWRHTHAHRSLVAWLNIHKRMSIVGASPSATAHRAAMLLTFYGRVSVLPPEWHLRGLGVSEATPYSESFVRSHKVIRWSGHLKPWMPNTPFRNLWLEYAIPDPIRKP